jgi:hypothetical protein
MNHGTYEELNENERNQYDIPANGQLKRNPLREKKPRKSVTVHRHLTEANPLRPKNLPPLNVPALMYLYTYNLKSFL